MVVLVLLLHYAHCNKQMTASSGYMLLRWLDGGGGASAASRHDYIILHIMWYQAPTQCDPFVIIAKSKEQINIT